MPLRKQDVQSRRSTVTQTTGHGQKRKNQLNKSKGEIVKDIQKEAQHHIETTENQIAADEAVLNIDPRFAAAHYGHDLYPTNEKADQSGSDERVNPRYFIDKNGGFQSDRDGIQKDAHDSWMNKNSWGLSRDDFIRLSYFHGCMEQGSDGSPSERWPINGSNWSPDDVVYKSESGGVLTRSMVSHWLDDCGSYMHGYVSAMKDAALASTQPAPQAAPDDVRNAMLDEVARHFDENFISGFSTKIATEIRKLKTATPQPFPAPAVQSGELPEITDDDFSMLHYNPNTSDVVEHMQNYARKAIAQTAPAGEAIPEGYALVPKVPTKEMLKQLALWTTHLQHMNQTTKMSHIEEGYTQMLAVAPSQGAKHNG